MLNKKIYTDKHFIVSISKSKKYEDEYVHIIRRRLGDGKLIAVGKPIISNTKLSNQEVYDRQ